MDKFYDDNYSRICFAIHKFDYFRELCRKGILDTSNPFILDMYNVAIRFDGKLRSSSFDIQSLLNLIDEFNVLDLKLWTYLRKEKNEK